MCFRFGSCFGSGSSQDYGRSTPKTTHGGGGRWSQADHGYYSSVDHKAPPAYQQQPAADEPGRRDNRNGVVRRDHVDAAGGHVLHPPHAQDKADDTLKHPATWNGKVGDNAGHTYTERVHDAAAYHREHAAADDHHYPPTTTTNLARY